MSGIDVTPRVRQGGRGGHVRSVSALVTFVAVIWLGALGSRASVSDWWSGPTAFAAAQSSDGRALDVKLAKMLADAGFTGTIEQQLEARLGRTVNLELANLGRLLWFDKLHSAFHDNTCGGCHSPTNGFGDSQPMAIGVQNNNKVGPDREGPRNQRRSPMVVNNVFYPALMWNARFIALSGDPFDNSEGFLFPNPEGLVRFPPGVELNARGILHLLQAQAHIPPTETVEVAGFRDICRQEGRDGPFCQFDVPLTHEGIVAERLPAADVSGFRNEPIRQLGLKLLNANDSYRSLFASLFPEVAAGGAIDFDMFGRAIAEFEFLMVAADAPLDRFARGDPLAMTAAEKRGALLFFGKAGCVQCHAVAGPANEMFSDFQNHVAGVPQVAPVFGIGTGNLIFDGLGRDEDFGQEQVTGSETDRYKFRTAPLRNLKLAPGFFHDGAFATLEGAIRFHLNAPAMLQSYDLVEAGAPSDLFRGPDVPLHLIDPRLQVLIGLSEHEIEDLVTFVRDGLYDPKAGPEVLCQLVPSEVPSGLPVLEFQICDELGVGQSGP